MNNTNELTKGLPQEPESAPSTAPLLKELLSDVRELKYAALVSTPQALELIMKKLESIEVQIKLLHEDQFGIRTDAVKLAWRVDELERRAS